MLLHTLVRVVIIRKLRKAKEALGLKFSLKVYRRPQFLLAPGVTVDNIVLSHHRHHLLGTSLSVTGSYVLALRQAVP